MDRDVFIRVEAEADRATVDAGPAAGGFPLLPLFFARVALAGVAHTVSRALVIGFALRLLPGALTDSPCRAGRALGEAAG